MSGVLVTGGTGKTGGVVTALLRGRGVDVRAGSRHPAPTDDGAIRFDWDDPATHAAALHDVDRIYLVPPPLSLDPMPQVGPFLAEARRSGVRRVVLLSSLIEFPNAPGMLELAARVRQEPGWVVLRPSAFMQNFLRPHSMAEGIRDRGEIRTAAGTGRVGWIDAHDIAASAAALLADPDGRYADDHRDDYVLTGPKALSYPDTARILTAETAREVRVVDVGVDEVAARFRSLGLPAPFADSLAALETGTRDGRDAQVTTAVLDLTGRAPRTFDDFVREHAGEWTRP